MAKKSSGSSGSAVLKTAGKFATPVTPGRTLRTPSVAAGTGGGGHVGPVADGRKVADKTAYK